MGIGTNRATRSQRTSGRLVIFAGLAAAALLLACNRQKEEPAGDAPPPAGMAPAPAQAADPGAAANMPAAVTEAPAAAACPPITPAEIAAGHSVFIGVGNCYTCHGPSGGGTALGPSLRPHTWLDISGSYESIAGLVNSGVPHPKKFPSPMPAKGGANLNQTQVCQVAAYVYSLSH